MYMFLAIPSVMMHEKTQGIYVDNVSFIVHYLLLPLKGWRALCILEITVH